MTYIGTIKTPATKTHLVLAEGNLPGEVIEVTTPDWLSYINERLVSIPIITYVHHSVCKSESLSMPHYFSSRSKNHRAVEEKTTITIEDSSSTSGMSQTSKHSKTKGLPSKAAKGVKRQLRRLDEFLHHVTHTKHEPTPTDVVRRRTVSFPSTPVSVIPSFVPSRERSTWNAAKYAKGVDSGSSKSSLPLSHQVSFSSEIGIQTDIVEEEMDNQEEHVQPEEHASEQSEPEQPAEDPALSDVGEELSSDQLPTHTDATAVYVEGEAPDPFLMDEEGDAQSEEDEGVDSSAAVSPPASDVPLDSSPSPQQQDEPQFPVTPAPDVNKDVPPTPQGNQSEEEEEEEDVPELYLPTLILPTMFLPIPNVRTTLPFYFLTWWLHRLACTVVNI